MLVDGVGNVDPTPALWTWTVDTTAPDTTIDSAIDGNNNPVDNGICTSSDSITFTFSGNPTDDVDHFVCSLALDAPIYNLVPVLRHIVI